MLGDTDLAFSREFGHGFALLVMLCTVSLLFFPVVRGPYSAVHGPVTALRGARSRLRMGLARARRNLVDWLSPLFNRRTFARALRPYVALRPSRALGAPSILRC